MSQSASCTSMMLGSAMPAATSRSSPFSPEGGLRRVVGSPVGWAAGRTFTTKRFSNGSRRDESVTMARKVIASPTWQLSGSWTLSVPMPFCRFGPT